MLTPVFIIVSLFSRILTFGQFPFLGYTMIYDDPLIYETAGSGDFALRIHDGILNPEEWDSRFSLFKILYATGYDRIGYRKFSFTKGSYSSIRNKRCKVFAVYPEIVIALIIEKGFVVCLNRKKVERNERFKPGLIKSGNREERFSAICVMAAYLCIKNLNRILRPEDPRITEGNVFKEMKTKSAKPAAIYP